jgi:hypothetical protein
MELAVCLVLAGAVRSFLIIRSTPTVDIRIPARSARPQLAFACELDTPQLQALFADPNVTRDLKQLNAGVSVSLIDLSPGRAEVVRRLNDSQIPVMAWRSLPKEQGYYLNSSNAPLAAARFADFEKWTAANGLLWSGIGLDIEPNLQEFAAVRRGSILRAAGSILRRQKRLRRPDFADALRRLQRRYLSISLHRG